MRRKRPRKRIPYVSALRLASLEYDIAAIGTPSSDIARPAYVMNLVVIREAAANFQRNIPITPSPALHCCARGFKR